MTPTHQSLRHMYYSPAGATVSCFCVLVGFLNLEGAQAGLRWETILKKREAYRKAVAGLGHVA